MRRVILHRIAQAIPVIIGVSFLTFVFLNILPGDPATAILGEQATPATIAAVNEEFGLNRPFMIRYIDWAGHAVIGDLGTSLSNRADVMDTILAKLPVSVEIMVLAQVIALGVAVPLATFASYKRDTAIDRIIGVGALSGLSVPNFLLAIVLIFTFAVSLGWLPAVGWVGLSDDVVENLRHAILPAVTLALSEIAIYFRVLRSEMIETFQEEYVATAYAKGLSVNKVIRRHVLRNSLFTLITVVGINIGTLIGGAVITETVFAVPGVGRLLIDSILSRDLFMVQGVVLFIVIAYVFLFLIVDLLYLVLDPRIRADDNR